MLSNEMIELVKSYCSWEPSIYEIEAAEQPARRKLADLINRFGDDNGMRLKPKYLAQLIMEQMRSQRAAVMFQIINEKRNEQAAQKFQIGPLAHQIV